MCHRWFLRGQAATVLDEAGWCVAHDLRVPDNVILVLQLPYSPEPWRRARHASQAASGSAYASAASAIADALCHAWSQLTPERLGSLASYPCLEQVSDQAGRHHSHSIVPGGLLVMS